MTQILHIPKIIFGVSHTLNNAKSSQAMVTTGRCLMRCLYKLGLERFEFVLFIASIEREVNFYSGKGRSHDVKLKDIKLRPFLF